MRSIRGDLLDIDRKERAQTPSLEIDYRSPEERVCDFNEVNLQLTPEQAMYEASRCIQCPDPAPCVRACPVENDIPSAMWLISQGKFSEAAKIYRKTSSMPEVCGRICPHEILCQGSCSQSKHDDPVPTGYLEAFVTCYMRAIEGVEYEVAEPVGQRVAIVGAGPTGMSAADLLAQKGYEVTLFDSKPKPGGLLLYGIPNFKLDKKVVSKKVDDLYKMGVKFVGNTFIGKDKSIEDLQKEGFDAIYLGIGTGIDAPMKIDGEDLPGVWKGTEFLIRSSIGKEILPKEMKGKFKIGKKVVVIGGGDTASDCLRTAVRSGSEEVTCLYRRTENEMPGSAKDRQLAREEGAKYDFLTQPIKFIADEKGNLASVECVRMELGEAGSDGRRRPEVLDGSNFILEADTAVLALGYWPDETISNTTPGLKTHNWGLLFTDDETHATSLEGVFAGGDAVTGPDLVVTAMRTGRQAAGSIDKYLTSKRK
jgi:glutamate synthase (NADPH/NADH) small chain